MVNTGKRSLACETCKRRRIKCDATTPVCQQCVKSRKPCLGYGESRRNEFAALIPAPVQTTNHPVCTELLVTIAQTFWRDPSPLLSSDQCPAAQSHLSTDYTRSFSTIRDCFFSLRQPYHSVGERRSQLANYNDALRVIQISIEKDAASPVLLAIVFLFTLYEMIVKDEFTNQVWRIHLDGLLSLLKNQVTLPGGPLETLAAAIYLRQQGEATFDDMIPIIALRERLPVLMDVAKVWITEVAVEYENLFQDQASRPRKLDVQKVHSAAKRVKNFVELFPAVPGRDSQEETDTLAECDTNVYRTLKIIILSICLECGRFIDGDDKLLGNKRCTSIKDSMQKLAEEIKTSSIDILKRWTDMSEDSSNYFTNSDESRIQRSELLYLLWPLACAFTVEDISEDMRDALRGALKEIGKYAIIPIASHLAEPGVCDSLKPSEVIAGLIVTGIAVH